MCVRTQSPRWCSQITFYILPIVENQKKKKKKRIREEMRLSLNVWKLFSSRRSLSDAYRHDLCLNRLNNHLLPLTVHNLWIPQVSCPHNDCVVLDLHQVSVEVFIVKKRFSAFVLCPLATWCYVDLRTMVLSLFSSQVHLVLPTVVRSGMACVFNSFGYVY